MTATIDAAPLLPAPGTSPSRHRPGGSDLAPRPGAWYAVPAALFFGLFAVLPVVGVVVLSFTEWTGIGDPIFIGTDNWGRLADDPRVIEAAGTTLLLIVFGWATQTPVAMAIGVWAAGRQRNRAVLSSVFFLPLLLSTAAVALMWNRFLDPNFGLAADVGPLIGYPDGGIVGDRHGALGAVVFVAMWQWVPFHSLLYQAAARNVPQVLYDAAVIDGASRWQQFRRVTLPQLRHTVVTSSVIMVVGSLTTFETILLLTNGGPGTSTYVLSFLMYRSGFFSFEFGYAAAIAATLLVVGTAVSLIIVRFSGFAGMRSTLEGL